MGECRLTSPPKWGYIPLQIDRAIDKVLTTAFSGSRIGNIGIGKTRLYSHTVRNKCKIIQGVCRSIDRWVFTSMRRVLQSPTLNAAIARCPIESASRLRRSLLLLGYVYRTVRSMVDRDREFDDRASDGFEFVGFRSGSA